MFVAKDAPWLYRLFQRVIWGLLRVLARLDVTGFANVPATGPLIVAPNHLHSLDTLVVGAVIPRWQAVFSADKFRGTLGGRAMELATRVIYVARGEADRAALSQGLAVLREGKALAVAPEGTRSRTGGLQIGKPGAVYLASRTGATIVPVAVWGQERAMGQWAHLRRATITVRILEPLVLPESARHAKSSELEAHTHRLMLALAGALPAEYRGIYSDRGGDADESG